jgi:hypothetical protein
MNPQMNYTPQQVMGHDSYSVPCRVGNWAEDEYMGALLTGDHQARSEKGMLMTQKLESTLGSALAPTGLTVIHPDGNLRFGDEIMLSNAQGGVLATNPQVREKLSQHTFVTSRTMVERPCRRTCFRIVPHSAAAPEDGLLRFGMAFGLMSVGDDGEELHLQSMRYTMANMNFSRSVRGAERKNGVNMAVDVSWQTAWEVVLLAPAPLAQLRSEGMPVPANTYVALRHKSSQANLRTTLDCLLRVTTHDSRLTTHHSPLTSHHSPLTTHHSPLATHHSPLTTHHSPLTTHHLPRRPTCAATHAPCATCTVSSTRSPDSPTPRCPPPPPPHQPTHTTPHHPCPCSSAPLPPPSIHPPPLPPTGDQRQLGRARLTGGRRQQPLGLHNRRTGRGGAGGRGRLSVA